MTTFNGLGMHLGNLSRLSRAKSRSLSAENPTGEKGRGGMSVDGVSAAAAAGLGQGWKVNPFVRVPAGTTHTLADVAGPGAIQQIWMTLSQPWRDLILRFYWDGEQTPSVECPAGDFFCCGWGRFAQVNALAVNVNPGSAFNCFWEMPFRKHCRITIENRGQDPDRPATVFYQINYTLTDVPDDAGYFHAQFRRSNPLPFKQVHTLLDSVKGWGQYVGTYMAWGVNNNGWWGEGEIKFYIDGDAQFPTICGTGTEDYFGGSYNFWHPPRSMPGGPQYCEFSTPYMGLPQVIRPDGCIGSQQRFGLYRFHVTDPIRFERDLRVTLQALGWRNDRRYLPLQDDISSVAYWYQAEPHGPFPALPEKDCLEIV